MKLQRTMHLRRNRSLDQRAARGFDSRRILHSASDAILSVGHDTTILLANPAAARMFDTGVPSLQGSALARFIAAPGADARTPLDYFPAGLGRAGRRATDYAVTGIRSDGERFPIEGSISSVDHDGRPIYTIILRDVTERHLVQQTLARSHDQLRQLSSALQSIREEERTHIARELHDDLGPTAGLAAHGPARCCSVSSACPRPARRLISGMESNLLTAIASLRRIATNLRPRALDEGGLYFALQGLRDEFIERHGIACSCLADEAELRLDDAASTAIFRIVQEALTNIARHAGASSVTVYLYRIDGELLTDDPRRRPRHPRARHGQGRIAGPDRHARAGLGHAGRHHDRCRRAAGHTDRYRAAHCRPRGLTPAEPRMTILLLRKNNSARVS